MKNNILINKIEYDVNKLVNGVKAYGNVGTLLSSKGIALSKELRVEVLKDLLRDIVLNKRRENVGLASDLAYRLGFFELYSEFQLQNLLFGLGSAELENEYLVKIIAVIFENIKDNSLLSEMLSKKGETKKVFDIDVDLDKVFGDVGENFDNLAPSLIRPILFHASLTEDLRELGLKYGVTVPKRLRKGELIEDILSYFPNMKDDEKNDLRGKLSTMHPTLIARFAKDNNILLSQGLKKEEIIEYILRNAPSYSRLYVRPTSRRAYYLTSEQIQKYHLEEAKTFEESVEEVVVEKETVVVPVKEEPDKVVVTKTVVVEKIEVEPEQPKAEEKPVVVEEKQEEKVEPKNKKYTFLSIMLFVLIAVQLAALILIVYFLFR